MIRYVLHNDFLPGDWYDNLVKIENNLLDRNIIRGSSIFNVRLAVAREGADIEYCLDYLLFSQTSCPLVLKMTTYHSSRGMYPSFI